MKTPGLDSVVIALQDLYQCLGLISGMMDSAPGPSNKRKITEYNIHRKIFVGNISYRVKSRKLTKFFSKFGPVEYCYIVKDHIKKWSKGIAFITFKDEKSMQKAVNASEDELFFDQRQMRVKPAELSSRVTYWQQTDSDDDDDNSSVDEQLEDVDHSLAQNTQDDTACPIDRLIDDVLIHIFSMLSWKERIGVERVCRRWKLLMLKSWTSQKHLQFHGVFRQFQGLTDKMINSLLKRCGQYLHSLDLSSSPRYLTDFTLDIIGKYCPDIKDLDLSKVGITDVSVKILVSKCRKLERIRLKRCLHITDKGVNTVMDSGLPLISLDLSDLGHLTRECFKALHNQIDTLRHLTLNNCHHISDEGLIKALKQCPNVEELVLTKCASLSGTSMKYICEHCQLRVLHDARVQFDISSQIKNLTFLEDLDLSKSHTVNDQVMLYIAEGCKKLRHLNISECRSMTDAGIMALSKIPTLESINISGLVLITETSIVTLAKVGTLEKFVARATKAATDNAISLLVALCPKLCYIDLSGCFEVTNNIFESFKNALMADPEKTVDLKLGGTSVDWVAEDVDWMSGFAHLNVSMQNVILEELLAYEEAMFPSTMDEEVWDDQLEDIPLYAPVAMDQQVEFCDEWDENDDYDDFLDNDDPLENERWNMS